MTVAQQMMGLTDKPLYSDADIRAIREQLNDITARVTKRDKEIKQIMNDELAVGGVS
jgi:hypothetical protein